MSGNLFQDKTITFFLIVLCSFDSISFFYILRSDNCLDTFTYYLTSFIVVYRKCQNFEFIWRTFLTFYFWLTAPVVSKVAYTTSHGLGGYGGYGGYGYNGLGYSGLGAGYSGLGKYQQGKLTREKNLRDEQ